MTPHLHIALALIWQEGRILISKRRADADHLPGLWEFPGGKCQSDETPAQCAVREAQEEVGLQVKVSAERTPITFDYPERIVTLFPFDCEVIGGEAQPLEVAAFRWVLPSELKIEDFPSANIGLIEELRMQSA
jgi:mutator protein MutT